MMGLIPYGQGFHPKMGPPLNPRGKLNADNFTPPNDEALEWFIEAGKATLSGDDAWYRFRRRMYARNWRRKNPEKVAAIDAKRNAKPERIEKKRAQARDHYYRTKHKRKKRKSALSANAWRHYLAYQRKWQRAYRARKKQEALR